ncbi:VCBS repeat-containing protein [Aquimarina aggregata]|uniref:VCBS repeat-containing protein n=1 Tax=Aquimarina aggregata TaxID=1642818 RepID=UPI0024927FD2|nr:VCBS repeat-containing protein [Aquimarina aggregata]
MKTFEIKSLLRNIKSIGLVFITTTLFLACSESNNSTFSKHKTETKKLFTTITSTISGIDFENKLIETLESNYYQYMYTYIGGGVAAADFNNDGLVDLFFISNTHDNKLYLNQGDFRFKDITKKAGIQKRKGFDSGVAVADVNNDGFVDIYISRGGWQEEDNKFANMLYINNGDLTFTEKAEALGLADKNRTIQATFFDYDNDNDLDVYISNTPDITSRSKVVDLKAVENDPKTLQLKGSDRLYNNDGTGHFTDVSEKSGLVYDIGFGLNPQVGDLTNDGLLDIYVCNDFNVPDLAYINNGDGTFTESRDKLFKHMSFNSMGSDIADINNDGLPDLMTLDMNPEDYIRSKTTMAMTSIEKFDKMVANGYHQQYMHNMLQLNNGNNSFSEIAHMSGIANTDWSWSLLAADFDLDGYKDIYITNGVYRDVIDRDKNNEILQILRKNGRKPTQEDFLSFAKMLPQQKLTNYFYKNKGNKTFQNTSSTWVDTTATFSNGAVYADLDNDGDLDIVVNNINDKANILKNNAIELQKGDFVKVRLEGPKNNNFGIGTKVKVYFTNNTIQSRQLINTRGFLSSVSNVLHFGFKKQDTISKIEITWPDGKQHLLQKVSSNKLITAKYASDTSLQDTFTEKTTTKTIFKKTTSRFGHIETAFNDYDLQILLPHKLSQTGPAIAKSDVNNDGYDDIFIGGAHGYVAQLLLGNKSGDFKAYSNLDFKKDKQREDVGASFFDVDNDGDQDLYVVSGSYEFNNTPKLLQDRLYLNNGAGQFSKSKNQLPEMITAGSVVVPNDYDNDGDIDLFVGGRVIPGKYPYAPSSYLLINDNGKFIIQTPALAPGLQDIGMVTDAVWVDINNDKATDLVVTGEWMGIEVFINKDNKLLKSDHYETLSSTTGWWNKILVTDIDNDGDQDIIGGNLGLNYKFHASKEKPFHVYTRDFDFNGKEDIILAKYYNEKQVPVRGKVCTAQQIPHLAKKITTYNEFANKDLGGILGKGITSALHYQAIEFRSGIFKNNGNGAFEFSPLPIDAQQSPINSILFDDFDGDQIKDLLVAGNSYQSEVETTRADAGIGSFLKGNGTELFSPISNQKSGFFTNKDTRHMLSIKNEKGKFIIVANNNDLLDIFKAY